MIICPLLFVCVCIHSKTLQVRIINMQEYEKRENFYIVLEEPKWLKRGISGLCVCLFLLIITDIVVFSYFLIVGDFYECLHIFSFVEAIKMPVASYSPLRHTHFYDQCPVSDQ